MNETAEHWNDIRRHYDKLHVLDFLPSVWACGDGYGWSGLITLTPIEQWLWSDIRHHGAVLYPQYPVGKYFVDFASPRLKVAIECDGAAFHRDREKDAFRQAQIEALGWTVYRISGADCRTQAEQDSPNPNTAGKFISDICATHPAMVYSLGDAEARRKFPALAEPRAASKRLTEAEFEAAQDRWIQGVDA